MRPPNNERRESVGTVPVTGVAGVAMHENPADLKVSVQCLGGLLRTDRIRIRFYDSCFFYVGDVHGVFLSNVRYGGTGGSSSDSTRDVVAGCLA